MALHTAAPAAGDQRLSRSSPPVRLTIRTHNLRPSTPPPQRPPPPPPSEQNVQFSTPSSTPSTPKSSPPNSPHSPWTRSPLHTPPPPPPQRLPPLLPPEDQISSSYHCIASLHRQDGNLYSIAVSKGTIFTGSDSKHIRAWKQTDFIERGSIRSNSGQVETMLAYNNTLFTSHGDCKIRVWSFSTLSDNFQARKVTTLPPRSNLFLRNKKPETGKHQNKKHKDIISCMAYYHPDGLLYTGSFDRTVKAWRVCDKRCVDAFVAHDGHVNAIAVNQDDGCVFTCSTDGTVKIWRRVYKESSHALTMTLKFQQSPINALALITSPATSCSPPTCSLYSGSSDGTISFWEKESLSSRFNHGGILQGHRFAVLCLVAIGRFVFSGSQDTTVRVWKRFDDDGDNGEKGSCVHQCVAVLNGHMGPVRCLSACLDAEDVVTGFLVYSAGLDQSFKVWRVNVIPDLDKDKNKERMCLDYDVSPVLSPSWVEKKVQRVRNNPFGWDCNEC